MADAKITLAAVDQTAGAFAAVQAKLSGLGRSAELLSTRFGGIGASLTAALSVATVSAFARATINGVDRLNDLADATGSTVENLSALEDIGARTGTSIDTVGQAVLKMNKVLSDAKPGTDQAEILKNLGLNAAALKQQDPSVAVRDVAVALSTFTDNGTKARYVQELFGKSTKEVAAFLKDLAGAGGLNATVTTQQAKEAERFNQQLAAMAKNSQDTARAITADLLPAANQFLERLNGNRKGGGFFASIGQEIKANIASDQLRVVVFEIESIQSAIDRQGATPLLAKRMAELREEAKQLSREAQAASEKLKGFADVSNPLKQGGRPANEGGGGLRSRLLLDLPDKPAAAESVKRFITNSFDQGLQDALKELDKTDAARVRELEAALSALFDLQRETRGDPAVVQGIARVREELAAIGPEAKKAAEEKKRLDAILAATPQGILQDVLTDIELINRAFDNGAKDTDKWAAAIRVAVAKLPQETEKALDEISEFAREASRNIQDALGDSVLATFEGNADSITKIWGRMLKRLVAQAVAADLAESLFGKGYGTKTNSLGGLLGMLGGLFGGTNSGGSLNYSGQFDGFRASGGPVRAGQAYIVGEKRPEVFVPDTNGTIVPSVGAAGGPSLTVNVQGDFGANAQRYMDSALSMFAVRMQRRRS